VLGGFEAFRRLQMLSTNSQIPILVYTSLSPDQVLRRDVADRAGPGIALYPGCMPITGTYERVSGRIPGSPGEVPDPVAVEPLDPGVFGVLLSLEADAPGFLAELVAEFRDSALRRVTALRDAVRTGDAEALKFAAHSLRGSCGTLGASGMAALAARLEDLPPASPEEGLPIVDRLQAEYEVVRRALDRHVPAAPRS
jgi:HPt (histidine-containing phosphotransfer) domain-containing protein